MNQRLPLLLIFATGCFNYDQLSARRIFTDGGSPDDGNVSTDGSTAEPDLLTIDLMPQAADLARSDDLAKPGPGSACSLGDAGAGIMSTAGTCLSSTCSNGSAMVGFSPPSGTSVSSSPVTGSPAQLIDGNICSGWNAGTVNATVTLMFPSPVQFSQVQVANGATPTTNENYTFYGLVGASWIQIGAHTYAVGPYGPQAPTSVTPGIYGGLQVVVSNTASAVLLFEVTLM